jgi:hypothetical protein
MLMVLAVQLNLHSLRFAGVRNGCVNDILGLKVYFTSGKTKAVIY